MRVHDAATCEEMQRQLDREYGERLAAAEAEQRDAGK
jgi:hypothetical protein